jgi:hypothetical protein
MFVTLQTLLLADRRHVCVLSVLFWCSPRLHGEVGEAPTTSASNGSTSLHVIIYSILNATLYT